MKININPSRDTWAQLVTRPSLEKETLSDKINVILNDVKKNGNSALIKYTKLYDGIALKNLNVLQSEIDLSLDRVDDALKQAIQLAANNIEAFHRSQVLEEPVIETTSGVKCWRKSIGIEKVGLYIPGGSAPLFSTILMLGIPAKIAGCKEIVLCTPPDKNGNINPAILYTANLVGITLIYKVGGAQAIAAMSFGTESIPQVYKIFGPGNQYVTKAKEIVQQQGTAIDMPAGPSELLVLTDDSGIPEYIAADLLSQAEHGADSQVILVSTDEAVLNKSIEEVNRQIETLPRKEIARMALANSKAVLLNSIDECFNFSNLYAPEHLIIASEKARSYEDQIVNAGSVFLGNYSCESAGDYASGTNHTLPTNGYAKKYSGVSIDNFVKKVTFQELSKAGLYNIGQAIELMAEAEGLMAHKRAVSVRLKNQDNV